MLLDLVRKFIPLRLRRPIARIIGFRHLQLGLNKPVNYRRRSRRRIEEDVAYAIEISKSYINQVKCISLPLEGSRILELGPGHHFAPNLVLASCGADVAVADRFLATWDDKYHPEFYKTFEKSWGHRLPAIDTVLSRNAHCPDVIRMYPHPAEALTDIEDRTQHIVLSNAVLEHVFSLSDVCREMARVTVPGGFNIHQVDFRDHRDFSRPLEFLLMSDEAFSAQFNGSNGECGNRLRASDVCSGFEENGFELVETEINGRADADYLRRFLLRLRSSASRYRAHTESDFSILGARFIFRRLEGNVPGGCFLECN